MSENDAAPDPIDEAYLRAEAVLSDDEARAARRARVLAAVAREPATPPTAVAAAGSRRAWRYGGWLAAACVGGLSVIVAIQVYRPPSPQPRTPPAPAADRGSSVGGSATKPGSPAPALESEARPAVTAPGAATPAPATSPAARSQAAPPLATAEAMEPARLAAPDVSPPPAPPPPAPTAAAPGAAADEAAGVGSLERSTAQRPSDLAMAAPSAARPPSRAQSPAGAPSDLAARLRAAAAAGRTADVAALLEQGAPIDAADADGDTALMKSIRANHPAAAAVLRRHGASLDRRNHAGKSARDLAAARGDAELDQALGLGP